MSELSFHQNPLTFKKSLLRNPLIFIFFACYFLASFYIVLFHRLDQLGPSIIFFTIIFYAYTRRLRFTMIDIDPKYIKITYDSSYTKKPKIQGYPTSKVENFKIKQTFWMKALNIAKVCITKPTQFSFFVENPEECKKVLNTYKKAH